MANAPAFSQRYMRGDYLEQVPDWHTGDAAWKSGKVFELMNRNCLNPASVCDVGCGAGEVLSLLAARMHGKVQFSGFDISPQAIALAKAKTRPNLEYHQQDFLAGTHAVHDLVLLLDVLEHIPDYLGFLGRLRERGQRFIFHIPLDLHAQSVVHRSRYMLAMRKEFGHLHYFTSETAFATLEDTGYRVVDSFYTWDHESEELGILESVRHPLRWTVRKLERGAFRWKPALAASLRPHFNLLVLAEPAPNP